MSNSQMRWSPFIWLLANHFFLKNNHLVLDSCWDILPRKVILLHSEVSLVEQILRHLFEGRSTYA